MRTAKREHYDMALETIASGQWDVDPAAGIIYGGRGYTKRPIGVLRRGYIRVRIGYKGPSVSAHRVIWEYCHGPIADPKLGINHRNGDKADNRISNLELATNGANVQHAYDTGLARARDARGSRNNLAKVTESDVRTIRDRVAAGEKQCDVRLDYGLSPSGISQIVVGRTWPHVAA